MTAKRGAAYIGFGTLAAAWLSSAAGLSLRQAPEQHEQTAPVSTMGTETLAADVQAQAGRLRDRMLSAPIPQEPLRNPFAFAPRPEPSARRAAAPALPPVALPVPPPANAGPPLQLIGIAETQTSNGIVRTAVIMDGDTLLMLTVGQAFAGRYRVSAIGADAVELADLVTSGTRRLALR